MTDREHARKEAAREADADRDECRAELLQLSNELRGDVRSFYDGDMEATGFVRQIRAIANTLEVHADATAGAQETPPFPEFAAQRAKCRQYSVEREPRPEHDGDHVRIRDLRGSPDTSMVLSLIRAANAEGWRMADYHESGDELLFVPFEGGERR